MRITFAAIAALTFILLAPAPARAQWTTPDASGNINSTNTGNIGIGTTTPAGKLDVSDDLRVGAGRLKFTFSGPEGLVQGATERLGFSTPNAGNSAQLTRMRLGGLAANSTIEFLNVSSVFLSSTSAKFGLGTSNPTSKFHLVSGTDNGTTMLHMDTGVHGGTTFAVGGTANNESTLDMSVYRAGAYVSRFGVHSSGNVYLQPGVGNVGIGTMSPQDRLHVNGSLRVQGNNLNGDITVMSADGTTGKWDFFASGTNGSTGFYDIVSGTIPLAVEKAAPSNTLYVTASGRVGVGNAAPSFKLDVSGQVRSSSGGFVFPDGTVQTTAAGASSPSGWTDSGASVSLTSAAAKVGIGTASPSAKLDVLGVTKSDGFNLNNTAAEKSFAVQWNNGVANQKVQVYWPASTQVDGVYEVTVTGHYWFSNSNGGIRKRIVINGRNVGIINMQQSEVPFRLGFTGNSDTVSDIMWDAANSRYYFVVANLDNAQNTITIHVKSITPGQTASNADTLNVTPIYTTDATAYPQLQTSIMGGNLGVGTSTPGYKLDVSGQIRSSSGGFVFPDGSTQTTAATAVSYGSSAGTAVQGNTTLTVSAGAGMLGGGQVTLGAGGTLTLTNNDKGSAQNIFKNVANAAGVAQFSAGANNDSILFEGTGGTTVSFNAAAKKVTINSSSSASSGWTDAGSSVSVTSAAAKVGLGTSGPTAGLDVQTPVSGATANGVRLQQTLTPTNNNGTLNALYINPTFNDGVAVGNVHNALVTGAGNVGLGTTATAAGLDVQNVGAVSSSTTYGARFKQTLPAANNYTDSTAFMIDPTFSDGAAVGVRHNGLVVTSGNVGIGTSTPASQLTVNLSNSDYVNAGGANSHVLMTNPSATGQNVFSSVINGAVVAKWRTDYLGNISSVAGGAGEHYFYTGGDYGVGQIRMSIKNDGRVGIGTTTPGAKLSLTTSAANDGLLLNGSANWALLVANLGDGSYNNMSRAGDRGIVYGGAAAGSPGGGFVIAPWASATSGLRIDAAGNVGIGTATPSSNLHVYAPASSAPIGAASVDVLSFNTGANALNSYFFRVRDLGGASTPFYIRGDGSVGIGTTSPGARLDVNAGSNTAAAINVTGTVSATGAITGASVNATYQDVAEWVPSSQKLSAGTVVVLDKSEKNHVLASTVSYDTKVAGVISAEPGVILGVAGEGKLKVATTGRVKVKVDAARGAIEVGDLLVTSDTQGVAMKSVEVDLGGVKIHRPGTIIGKALEPLASGTGEILVLLSLQ